MRYYNRYTRPPPSSSLWLWTRGKTIMTSSNNVRAVYTALTSPAVHCSAKLDETRVSCAFSVSRVLSTGIHTFALRRAMRWERTRWYIFFFFLTDCIAHTRACHQGHRCVARNMRREVEEHLIMKWKTIRFGSDYILVQSFEYKVQWCEHRKRM